VTSLCVRIKADVESALEAFPPPGRNRGGIYLTPKEIAAFRLLSVGLSNDEIGVALNVKNPTVRTWMKNIHDKCRIEGRSRLIAVACYIWPSAE
jgi:DNA-binding CsgD family transcriptional regulator